MDMRCLRCGECCRETEMELTEDDVKRLARLGFPPEEFTIIRDGVLRLKNVNGWCYFYDVREKKCRVYPKRPVGCRVYPIVYIEGEGFGIDSLCPSGRTISKAEFNAKTITLRKLLKRLEEECGNRLEKRREGE